MAQSLRPFATKFADKLPIFNRFLMGTHTFAECAVDAIDELAGGLRSPKDVEAALEEAEDELGSVYDQLEVAITEGLDVEAVVRELLKARAAAGKASGPVAVVVAQEVK